MKKTFFIERNGESTAVSGLTFWKLALPVLALVATLAIWAIWLIYLSTHMLEHYTGVPAFGGGVLLILLLGQVSLVSVRAGKELGGETKAIFPLAVRTALGSCLFLGTVYFQYAVQHWGVISLFVLVSPPLLFGLRRLWAKKQKSL